MRPFPDTYRTRYLGATLALTLVALSVAFDAGAQTNPDLASPADLVVCSDCELTGIQEAVDLASDGDRIEVRGGVHPGGIVIDKSVALIGTGDPVIDGEGEGTLVWITAAGVTIDGFTLRNSGNSHDKEDTGILVDAAGAVIVDNTLEDVLFGIYLRQAPGSLIQNNVVSALPVDVAMRGDGIRVWYSDNVTIDGNTATDGRDIILWYSNGAVVTNNAFDRNRYGMHLMFSNEAIVQNNSLDNNTIGLYVMYSRTVDIVGNSISNNAGATGGGLGLKDVDEAHVEGNRFVNNQTGIQIDTSPREPNIVNAFIGNVIAFNDIGIAMQPAVRNNTFLDNAFIDNNEHISLLGRGELKGITWAEDGRGNYWSDYAGYDADGDGVGDLPYVSEQLFESLLADNPELRLFSYSPASMAIDFAAKAFPSFRPQVKFEDPNPLMSPTGSPFLPPIQQESESRRVMLGLSGIAVFGVASVGALRLRQRSRFPTTATHPRNEVTPV
ncbi:MAG: nitrous oxide reductase family maturation protein NosD [Thermomicrobiales bacterium]|nr:nitrous oxide reductase family maturation protein NosD [Thermomicrobiales bacterium]MCO5222003.1 nitrous oxide reductase family maturation protein NosD [Thermomicrobiales bacterium]